MPSCFTCAVRREADQVSGAFESDSSYLTLLIQEESTQTQGLLQSLIAKIINNVQVTIKNIHVRYEDNLSVPGVSPHP